MDDDGIIFLSFSVNKIKGLLLLQFAEKIDYYWNSLLYYKKEPSREKQSGSQQ